MRLSPWQLMFKIRLKQIMYLLCRSNLVGKKFILKQMAWRVAIKEDVMPGHLRKLHDSANGFRKDAIAYILAAHISF